MEKTYQMKTATRFIVVDDDPINNIICQHIIRNEFQNADVKLYDEPIAALDNIKEDYHKTEKRNTVLFLDINMPTMNGWGFLDVFKDFNNTIREQFTIFMLTSSIDSRDKDRAENNPFVSGFISKPLTGNTLKQMLGAAN